MSYSAWLRSIVDLSDKPSCKLVKFLDDFDSLPYKSEEQLVQYARYWCILSDFLYSNRHRQLASDVEMLFEVGELRKKTDVYWFEVAQSCDKAATTALHSIVQWMGILPVLDAKTGYAETGLALSNDVLEKSMKLVKEVVGLCHYSLMVAASTCKFFSKTPLLLAAIKKRYHSFRVLGCWIKGMQELRFSDAAGHFSAACDWFERSCDLANSDVSNVVAAVALLVDSTPILKPYSFVLKSTQEGQKGYAKGFARQCLKFKAENPTLVNRIMTMTEFPNASPPPIVPPDNSPLLKIVTVKGIDPPLVKGTSPLGGLSLRLAQ